MGALIKVLVYVVFCLLYSDKHRLLMRGTKLKRSYQCVCVIYLGTQSNFTTYSSSCRTLLLLSSSSMSSPLPSPPLSSFWLTGHHHHPHPHIIHWPLLSSLSSMSALSLLTTITNSIIIITIPTLPQAITPTAQCDSRLHPDLDRVSSLCHIHLYGSEVRDPGEACYAG